MKIFRVYFYCILIAQFFLHPQWGLGFCWADSNCYYPTLWEVKATLSTFRSDFKFVTQFIWFSTPTGILPMTPTSGSWPRATCALFICNMLKGTFRLDELEYCSLKSAINLMTRWSLVTRQLFNNILTAQMTVSILTTNIGPVICMIILLSLKERLWQMLKRIMDISQIAGTVSFFWCLHPWQPNKIHRRPSEALTQRLVFLSDRLAAWLKKPKARSTRLTDSTCTFKLLWSLWSPWSNNLLPMETVSEKIHHFEVGNVIRFYLFSVHWFQNPNNWQ